ncbi:MAG: class I SAM-dependent methyltransferase [Chloroflexota bacterium]
MSGQHFNEEDEKQVVARYQKRIDTHGVTFESLASGSMAKQTLRHSIHAQALRTDTPAVLDIGCGLANFYSYLQQQGIATRYTGYDIVPEYVDKCRERYPEATFQHRNFLRDGIDDTFDTIVMSQVLNNRYANTDNMQIMADTLALAFKHTRISVSIDMMSSYVDYENDALFYYNPEAIFALARELTPRVVLRHDYRRFEFCIQLFHETDDTSIYIP